MDPRRLENSLKINDASHLDVPDAETQPMAMTPAACTVLKQTLTPTSATTETVSLYVYNMMKMVIHDFLMEQHHSLTNLFVTWQITFKKHYVPEKRLSAKADIC